MGRRLILTAVIFTLAVWAYGCGGASEDIKNAPPAQPMDLGEVASIQDGATLIGSVWVTKVEVNGEKRIYVLGNSTPNSPKRSGVALEYDPETKQLHDATRKFTYNLQGDSLRVLEKGPKKGGPGIPLTQHPVWVDNKTGHLIYTAKGIAATSRSDKSKKAYAVVP